MTPRLLRFLLISLFPLLVFSAEVSYGESRLFFGMAPLLKVFSCDRCLRAPLPIARRPKMARVPNLGIEYAPNLDYNLYLADQVWYLYYNDKWYEGETHEGPWRYLSYSKVPEILKKIPDSFLKRREISSPEVGRPSPVLPARKENPEKRR